MDGGGSHPFTHKIHVPLETNPAAVLHVDGEDFHLAAGRAWEVNNLVPHGAFNGGGDGPHPPHLRGLRRRGGMSRTARRYAAYGLRIRSEIALPLSPGSSPEGEPDVEHPRPRRGARGAGRSPARPPELGGRARPLPAERAEGVARYLVREGREIVVEPAGERCSGPRWAQ